MKLLIACFALMFCVTLANADYSTASPAMIDTAAEVAAEPSAADASPETEPGIGECGGNTCTGGTYCCNASCGRCVPKGMLCTQEAC